MSKTAFVLTAGVAAWAAVTALTLTMAAGYAFIESQNRFLQDSALTMQAIHARVYELGAASEIAGLNMGVGPTDRDDFRVLGDSIRARNGSVESLVFFPRVRPGERAIFEQRRQDEGFVSFRIRDWQGGTPLLYAPARSHYPATFIEPFTPRSARLLGRDAATLPCLASGVERALSEGKLALLDDCRLPELESGFWLLKPLYAGRGLPDGPEAYRARAQGIIALRFSPALLFSDTRLPQGLHCRIRGPGGRELFAQGGHAPQAAISTLERQVSLPIGSDRLTVDLERQVPFAELLVFGGGLSSTLGLLSALFAGLMASNQWERRRAQEALRRHRDHLEEEVALRTNELSEANRALQDEVTERRRAQLELAQLAIRDPLTGLYNRREMERRLDEEIERCRRYHHPLSVLMLDIDHFKRLNDTYGHLVGDEVLRSVASRIDRAVRNTDFVARYGGEEFLAILPDTPLESAIELAERIRNDIAGAPAALVNGQSVRVTASVGLSVFPPDGGDRGSLCRTADVALYRAKAKGRNRVLAYSEEHA